VETSVPWACHPGSRPIASAACRFIFFPVLAVALLVHAPCRAEGVSVAARVELASLAPARSEFDRGGPSRVAPRVWITAPASGSLLPTRKVVVRVTIADGGGGIGQVAWRLNGVFAGLERSRWFERIDLPLSSPGRSLSLERTLSLSCGMNRIEVTAHSARRPFRSGIARITVKWDGRDLMAARLRDPTIRGCDDPDDRFT
jgi:hypothetical protein